MKKSFQPTRFQRLTSKQPQPCTWEGIVNEIRNGAHAGVTQRYREVLLLIDQALAGGDTVKAEQLKLRKDELKRSQAAFLPSAVAVGGRSSKHVSSYSGFIMVDLDNIAPALFDAVVRRVQADKHLFLSYVTLSGKGLRVITQLSIDITTKELFRAGWQQVNDYYARLAGVPADGQIKDANRLSALCHDPEVVFRPDAEPFPFDAAVLKQAPERMRRGRPVTALSAADTVRRLVEEDGIRYEAHRHNAYISRCLYWMNRFGVSEAEAQAWALSVFADYDASTHSVAATVRSCYSRTEEHGTQSITAYKRRFRNDSSAKPVKATVEEMEAFVSRWGEFRMNTLIHQLEVRVRDEGRDTRYEGAWQRMTDKLENSLWCAMQRAGLDADLFRLRTLLMSDFVKEYHPLREYLASLPPWDGKTDYIRQLSDMVHCVKTSPERFDFYFRHWLVGMLAGALSEEVVNHVILVLLGRQGSFKSSFMENLLPPVLRGYYTSKSNSQRMTKDDLFTMTENLLVNFEEIDSMQRSELNQLKAMTTTLFINERPAYGRNKIRLPHVASFCATGNNLQFLTDDTGNRRWLTFEVEQIDNPWQVKIPYEGIYAQAKALLEGGYRYWFQDHEVAELNRRNRRFETPNLARELIYAHYRKPQVEGMIPEKARYLTASQIVARFGGAVRLSAVQVGRALKELGYEQVHTRHGDVWLMVELSPEEMCSTVREKILQEDAEDA